MTASKSLQERIWELEKQKTELLEKRKEEIFEVLNANSGICLDNRLLAGFALYASSEENKNDVFLAKLKEIGAKGKFPSRGKKPHTKSGN